jgi:type I restriction enzyme S subunit
VEVKPGYKQTDVGVIPEEWEATTIGDVASFSGGSQPPRSTFKFTPTNGFVRLIQIRDYKTDDFATFIPEPLVRKRCTEDDIMIGRYGPPIFQILRGLNGAYNVALIKSTPSTKIDREYFFNVLRQDSLFQLIEALSRRSSGQTGVEMPALKGFGLPLPPLPEQRAIAGVLSDVDALIGGLDQLIAKKRDLKQAAMQQLLTGQTRLPGFHGEWAVKRLGDVGAFAKGRGIKKDEVVADGLPCVRYGEIYLHHNDYLRAFNSFITPATAKESQRIEKGDLLFAGSGETAEEIGKCVAFLGDEEAYAGGDIVIFRPVDQDSKFLGYLMNHSSVVSQKACMGQGDAVVHISARNLARLEFHRPSLPEQTPIAEVLTDLDAELAALEQHREKTRALKQGMMQELLTGRTRLV